MPTSTKTAPWVCQRCYSRLTKSTPLPTTTRPYQYLQRKAYFSTSPHNASPDDPKPTQVRSNESDPSPSLPSHSESLRSPLSHRFTHVMDNLQSSLMHATQHINTLTGYTGIERLKASISAQETALQTTRAALLAARTAYSAAIKQRSASQREVNELLQRKHNWSSADLTRFTELYRSDHANELEENRAHAELVRAEKEAEEAGARLSESILARYHEEQIWSDKIRRMSTWGTWGLMGVNVLLFLVFQIGVEPWRRRRLVKGFEEKVQEALEREREVKVAYAVGKQGGDRAEGVVSVQLPEEAEREVQMMMDTRVGGAQGTHETLEAAIDEQVAQEVMTSVEVERQIDQETDQRNSPAKGRIFDYTRVTKMVMDLFSDRQVSIRKWDLTALVLEGAAAGMAVVGLIVILLRPK
ncbi:MAG: hypothetical protein L6R40_001819 [Gallowayella cf. fulva]|nr:MAG: hypothetical protein L6R40_001819 [Xanthomendoza cf. fulva]